MNERKFYGYMKVYILNGYMRGGRVCVSVCVITIEMLEIHFRRLVSCRWWLVLLLLLLLLTDTSSTAAHVACAALLLL